MDYSLLSGINSYLMSGSYSPYSLNSLNFLSGSGGVMDAFQSGVRFGQALEKAAANNPESAEQLQKILEEAFASRNSRKSSGTGSAQGNSVAAVYEPSRRNRADTGDFLAGRRAGRLKQRQGTKRSS